MILSIAPSGAWVILSAILGAFLIHLVFRNLALRGSSKHSALPLPPGPKPKSLIRTLLDNSNVKSWQRAMELCKAYGDVVYDLGFVGQHMVYLNSYEAAIDLLERRSSIYSCRNQPPFVQLTHTHELLSNLPYGQDWRLGRRVFHQEFNSNSTSQFRGIQTKYAHVLLALIQDDPTQYEEHLKYFSAAIIMESMYGLQIKSMEDPLARKLEQSLNEDDPKLEMRVFWAEILPIIKHIPDGFPGTGYRKQAAKQGEKIIDSMLAPFDVAVNSFTEGRAVPSFIASWLTRISTAPEDLQVEKVKRALQFASGTAFLASYESTIVVLLNFILSVVLHPDIQRKAHAELDSVIGRERLVEFADRQQLPYVNALYKEVMRFYPPAPLILPHRVIVEDEYKGMRIPKGASIIANALAISRDEREYGPDADTFRPERFLEANVRDPFQYVFGFGRRICPGRYLSDNNVFIAICTILQVFTIGKAKNADGDEIPIEVAWIGSGFHPESFQCSIVPRFEGAEDLIRANGSH